ncbi:hypothetical protein MMC25_000852 [Agyrium rufum]|nr:hypothetical protein [Agyrium rufum]
MATSIGSKPPSVVVEDTSETGSHPDPPMVIPDDEQLHLWSWASQDKRNASTESLYPSEPIGLKRKLLLVYIHGFMGDETSFQSFPSHVHNLLLSLLAETHIVHSKVYPRYKSRKAIDFARDDFSKWLAPHESDKTDVILLGHSLGGILAAEVALIPADSPSDPEPFRHIVLGIMGLDTPFLGMHPGVIGSGLASLFQSNPNADFEDPQPDSTQSGDNHLHQDAGQLVALASQQAASVSDLNGVLNARQGQSSSHLSLQPTMSPLVSPVTDPNFNPSYANDVALPIRKGWNKALYFITKHSEGLTQATTSYITSHLEFGGTLADFQGLRNRYRRIRSLEDGRALYRPESPYYPGLKKVRFVNYYTATTGKIAKGRPKKSEEGISGANANDSGEISDRLDPDTSVRVSSEEPSNTSRSSISSGYDQQQLQIVHADPEPTSDSPSEEAQSEIPDPVIDQKDEELAQLMDSLPTIPPMPVPPSDLDLAVYPDKAERKSAENERGKKIKAYLNDIKDREKVVKAREKTISKFENAREKEQAKLAKQTVKDREKEQVRLKKDKAKKEAQIVKEETERANKLKKRVEADAKKKTAPKLAAVPSDSHVQDEQKRPKHDKKFCMLPSTNEQGERDRCWERIFMDNEDEVGAHCGLFFEDKAHYEAFVYDVGYRIQDFILEAIRYELGTDPTRH